VAFRPWPESLSRPSFLTWSSTVLIQSQLTLGQAAASSEMLKLPIMPSMAESTMSVFAPWPS
jgi:hypothetical protein